MILIIASHNPNKKKEIQKVLPQAFQLKDLNDIGLSEEIEEHGQTLVENALIKAKYVHTKLNLNCIAEDSGLEIESLQGEPGVHSARYSGIQKNDQKNIELVLEKMQGKTNRKARFRTIIVLIYNDREYIFEGSVEGTIAFSPSGKHGFGYDPIFIPETFKQTFAELGEEIKVKISHRSMAVHKLVAFLENQK